MLRDNWPVIDWREPIGLQERLEGRSSHNGEISVMSRDSLKGNRGLTAMFDQPCQRGHLPLNLETLTIGNKPVTISGDPSKQPNELIKTKLKNTSTTITQEACGRASTTSQALKGINRLL